MELSIRLSMSNADANAPSEWFAQNHGIDTSVVFDGLVLVPSSPGTPNEVAGWHPEQTVRIAFDIPFEYTGGTLVLDLVGRPDADAPSDFWPVDADRVVWGRTGRSIGESCGNYHLGGIPDRAYCVGDTITVSSWGAPKTISVLLVGSELIKPIDLGFLGARGCSLLVQPDFYAFGRFSEEIMGSGVGGVSINMQIPNRSDLLGASLFAQWMNIERSLPQASWSNPAGFTTSNAYELVLNTSPASMGVSTVTSDEFEPEESPPATGFVETNTGPVLRFLYR